MKHITQLIITALAAMSLSFSVYAQSDDDGPDDIGPDNVGDTVETSQSAGKKPLDKTLNVNDDSALEAANKEIDGKHESSTTSVEPRDNPGDRFEKD